MPYGGWMERRRNTRPGVLQWTPAPLPSPPAADLTSEDSWEEEEDENQDDFVKQMDEDGIIGLSEALEDWELGGPLSCSNPGTPEETPPSGGVTDHQVLERRYGMKGGLKAWTEDQTLRQRQNDDEQVRNDTRKRNKLPPSHASMKSSPRCAETTLRGSPQPAASPPEQVELEKVPTEGSGKQKAERAPVAMDSGTRSLGRTQKDPTQSKQPSKGQDRSPRTPGAGNTPAAMEDFRRASLSRQRPDFSKVEPRVQFPKRGYKPPMSKHSLTRTPLSSEPPMVYKSPADIVKEVLFTNTDGSSDPNTPTGDANSTVPPEFRCQQEDNTLLQQLEENYNRLLTKLADAENTIDRFRLEAKVNLYSDSPKAGHMVHSGLNRNTSNLMNLDFSHAQRAEVCSTGQEKPDASAPQPEQQLSSVLFHQSEKFLQQLQTFEDLLQSDKLTSSDTLTGLSQLSEGLNFLERGYLLARDEHRLLQQRGEKTCAFDPERELEGLVFQCGMRVDELKEQVKHAPSPDPSEGAEMSPTHPQSPPEPVQIGPGTAAEPELSSGSRKSDNEDDDDDDDDDEETLKHIYFRPFICKDKLVEHEQTQPPDHVRTLQQHFRPPAAPSSSLNTPTKHAGEKEEWKAQRDGNNEVLETWAPRRVESEPHSPLYSSQQRSSVTSLPSCSPSSTPPAPSARIRVRLERRTSPSSSLSSLTDVTSERRSSKVQTGSRKVPSQDRIISPETDSGFVGSESSRLTPAAVPILPHQRASEGVLAPQDRNSRRPQSAPLSLSQLEQEPTGGPSLAPNQRGRSRQRRRIFTSSPQNCIRQNKQTRVDNGATDPWTMSDLYSSTSNAQSAAEEQRSRPFTESPCSSASPPAARRRHVDPQRAPDSRRGANHKEAFVTLQTKEERLKGKLDVPLRNEKRLSTVTAAASAQRSCSPLHTPSPSIRECWSDVSLGRRSVQAVSEIEPESVWRATREEELQQQSHVLRRSFLEQPQPQVSRCTQTSVAAHSFSPLNVRSRNTQTWSSSSPDEADEPDDQPSSFHTIPAKRPLGGSREPSDPPRCCHAICGRLKLHGCTDSDCCRRCPSTRFKHRQAESPDSASTRRYTAAAVSPSAMQYVPLYPQQLLLCSTPLHASPDHVPDSHSRPGRSKEKRGRRGRSHSVDSHRSLDRANKWAERMKRTTRQMVLSTASDLRQHRLLTQYCTS
uniref:AT-hook transcription factor n=1 Tax=Fundulus heteroclitus TaxID=8078 RepID=A0A3Q2QRN0_FUNHE